MYRRTRKVTHRASRLVVEITEIRQGDDHRDQRNNPEDVTACIPLAEGATRAYAFSRAQRFLVAMDPSNRLRYRVKVVSR